MNVAFVLEKNQEKQLHRADTNDEIEESLDDAASEAEEDEELEVDEDAEGEARENQD
jgi:hypothetical protein